MNKAAVLFLMSFMHTVLFSQTPAISSFTSVIPSSQQKYFVLPPTHNFQWLFGSGDTYKTGGGNAGANNDFTGYIPIEGSDHGYLCINHETWPGSISRLEIAFDTSKSLWSVIDSRMVTHDLPTGMAGNCSGSVTPWKTMVSCEEAAFNLHANLDGIEDYGWCIEVDPVTSSVMQYNTGHAQKLWKLGNMAHENLVVAADRRTVYYGEDGNYSGIYKFIADSAGDLSSGTMYSLKLDDPFVNGEPSGTTGQWVPVPNNLMQQCNDANLFSFNSGCNDFGGVEDVEIGIIDSLVYFSAKLNGRIYRFRDLGNSIDRFRVFAGGTSYSITTENGIESVDWGYGNDNLAFDKDGNLWVLQDGGNNYIWMIGRQHTPFQPDVHLFGIAPAGSEPTGITFSPDYRFLFMSFMHPDINNVSQTDASGNYIRFNRSASIVIARHEDLHGVHKSGYPVIDIFPQPSSSYIYFKNLPVINSGYIIKLYTADGQLYQCINGLYLDSNTAIDISNINSGCYIGHLISGIVHHRFKLIVIR